MGVETAEEEKPNAKDAGIVVFFPRKGLPRRIGRRRVTGGLLDPRSKLVVPFGGILAPSILNWRRF